MKHVPSIGICVVGIFVAISAIYLPVNLKYSELGRTIRRGEPLLERLNDIVEAEIELGTLGEIVNYTDAPLNIEWLSKLAERKDDNTFQRALVASMRDPSRYIGASRVLNELYPIFKHRPNFLTIGPTVVAIEIRVVDEHGTSVRLPLPVETYQSFARAYWEARLFPIANEPEMLERLLRNSAPRCFKEKDHGTERQRGP